MKFRPNRAEQRRSGTALWIASMTRFAIVREGKRAEVQPGRRWILDHRQAWPRGVDVEAHVAVAVDSGAGAVVAGEEPRDQPALDHLGGERVGQVEVGDRLGLAQHRADLAAVLAAEVRADPLAQIRRLADVQHVVALAAEHVHAGRAGQVGGHLELGRLRVPGELGERHEIVEAEHPEAGCPLDEQVEEVGGGERVVERSMAGLMIEPQARGERAELAVRNLVAQQAPGQRHGVDHGAGERRSAVALAGGAEEAHVEADVVAHDHRVADELDERRQDRTDARCVRDQHVGQPGEHGDLRRDRPAGVHQRLEGAETLPALHLDGADLGDLVLVAVAARGLEVDDAEHDLVQGRAEFVEGALLRQLGDRTR